MLCEVAEGSEDQARALRREIAPGMLWVECAWCNCDMGLKPCAPEAEGRVSHPICPACREKQKAKAADPYAGEDLAPEPGDNPYPDEESVTGGGDGEDD